MLYLALLKPKFLEAKVEIVSKREESIEFSSSYLSRKCWKFHRFLQNHKWPYISLLIAETIGQWQRYHQDLSTHFFITIKNNLAHLSLVWTTLSS